MKRLLLLLALPLALNACGRKGPPVAPQTRVPQPVADLRAVVQAGAIELNWTNPSRRMDHTRLRDLARARVFRAEDNGQAEPKPALLSRGRIAGYTELTTIRLDVPGTSPPGTAEAAVVERQQVRFTDRNALTSGRRYSYVVVTEDAMGRVSPPSDRVSVTFDATPAPAP